MAPMTETAPKLRDYQDKALADMRVELRQGLSVLLRSPTGSGKGVIIAHMMRVSAERGMTSWLLCHRKELITQLSDHLWSLGVQHGVIAAGRTPTHDPVQIGSVQTVVRRLGRMPPPRLLVIDEAHHATANTYRKIIEHCKDSFLVGPTATPQRTDGTGLGDIFDVIVHGPEVSELIDRGYLSQYRIIAPSQAIDTAGVHSRGGDYVTGELEAVVNQAAITGRAVEHYMEYVHPRTCLVYCVSRAHARHVAETYQKAGIAAVYVGGDTPPDERKLAIDGFRNGMPQVIVSVDLFGEGLDAPGLKAVQLLRPTKSLILHLQQIGRALRVEEGKGRAIILDHVGNTWVHGLPDEEREWTLEGKKKAGTGDSAIGLRHCPKCFSIFRAVLRGCPLCGWVAVVEARILEETDEKLVEIDVAALRAHRKKEERGAKDLESLVRLGLDRGYQPAWAGIRHALRTKTDRHRAIHMAVEMARGME
jgi:DNA repair protein RadD